MKILIGICGLGNGHLNRQANIIELLQKNNNQIVIAAPINQKQYFKNKFKNVEVINIEIPWITCNENGIDYEDTKKRYVSSKIDLFEIFLVFCQKVEQAFNGKPEVVITDYEPNVAQYSYIANIPLICMEQQSKFLYLEELRIENHSINEERFRINYFFPKYNYKIISSFFPIKVKAKNIKIVTPIITNLENATQKEHLLVYFSPYGTYNDYLKILDSLNKIKGKQIIVYTKENFKKTFNENITIKPFSDDFKTDLKDAYCLICTAGHQLISECISLNIPMYLLPLNTYEQNYNAKMVEKYGLGTIGVNKDEKEILDFINMVPKYAKKIQKYRDKYYKNDWQLEFLNIIKLFKK